MKVALLADVHGNREALAAVLEEASSTGAARLLVAGDLVGYYYDVPGVLRLLADWDHLMVRGNHEELLGQWRRDEDHVSMRRRWGSALEVACASLPADELDRLESLPHPLTVELAGRRVEICHGTPRRIDRYVYPDADPEVRSALLEAELPSDLVVYGHTHHPVVWRLGKTLVVNPGSVGQPRDGVPGACWALWDTERDEVELRRASYDSTRLAEEARRRDPELPYLADVLTRRR